MTTKELDTEQRILEAAKKIFHQKGFYGARMQDIADEADINKAMLHYYFRSKQKIFESVFKEAIVEQFGAIISILKEDLPLDEQLQKFAHSYTEFLKANPSIPSFITHEMSTNPENIAVIMKDAINLDKMNFLKIFEGKIESDELISINPINALLNLISMTVFPFIARPIIMLLFGISDKEYDQLIDQRKDNIHDWLLNGIKNKKEMQ